MIRRETRISHEGPAWLAAEILSTTVGLMNLAWLWLPVTVIVTRGALIALMWLRVGEARRQSRGQIQARAVAAVVRGSVRRHASSAATRWDDELLVGYLEATSGGWSWRPGRLSSREFLRLELPRASIQEATWSPTRQALMPAASYLRVRTHAGRRYDFLVWDYPRLPPMAPHREETPPGGDLPG
jgi:hypothetical protein